MALSRSSRRLWFFLANQLFDAHVLSSNLRPACSMPAHVDVQKAAVVNPDAASRKVRNGLSQVVHLLQRKAVNANVRGSAQNVLAVRRPSDPPVVFRATISGQHVNRLP